MPNLIIALIISALVGCTFDEDPDFFIDNMRPDLYFALKQPEGAVAASVAFTTKNPTGPTLPLNVRVLAWAHEGDNVYQRTLDVTVLEDPIELKGRLLRWSGTMMFPTGMIPGDDPFAQYVGVELRTFMPIAAFNGPPQSGEFCEADVSGIGVFGCGQWFEIFLRQWAVCRGSVGQLVDCEDLHYILLPAITTRGIGKRTKAQVMSSTGEFLYTSELYLYHDVAGWYYKALSPADFLPQPGTFTDRIAGRHAYGPFATAEQAARDAVAQLGMKPGWWHAGFAGFAAEFVPGTELHRAAAVLEELLRSDAASELPLEP